MYPRNEARLPAGLLKRVMPRPDVPEPPKDPTLLELLCDEFQHGAPRIDISTGVTGGRRKAR